MSQDKSRRHVANDAEPEDDVEILEVVGVDENGVPIDGPDPDDIEVVFDEAPPERRSADEAPTPPDARKPSSASG